MEIMTAGSDCFCQGFEIMKGLTGGRTVSIELSGPVDLTPPGLYLPEISVIPWFMRRAQVFDHLQFLLLPRVDGMWHARTACIMA
jgi:hypothetical protein